MIYIEDIGGSNAPMTKVMWEVTFNDLNFNNVAVDFSSNLSKIKASNNTANKTAITPKHCNMTSINPTIYTYDIETSNTQTTTPRGYSDYYVTFDECPYGSSMPTSIVVSYNMTDSEILDYLTNDMGFTTEDFQAVINNKEAFKEACQSSDIKLSDDEFERFFGIIKSNVSGTSDSESDYDRAMGIL